MKPPLVILTVASFLINSVIGPMPICPIACSAEVEEFRLPAPGVMVHLSPPLDPPILKGIKVHPDNPFRFEFIVNKGDSTFSNNQLKDESTKLIKYFLASLTIPEKDLWVNLSPYEKDRIIPNSFGLTEMGRDLLAEDYMLKQITASLIYPEGETGKKFWKRIYEEAAKKFGTTDIPVNTFNKVWIVPEKAVVYENAKAGTAYVVESKLKVMLEQDYLSLQKHEGIQSGQAETKDTNQLGSQIVRTIVIPELTKEVNEDKNFAKLRQVYNSLILATWYKNKIKDSILEQVYANKNKTLGVRYTTTVIPAKAGIHFKNDVEGLYKEYLRAFKKGVYNYIKEEIDPISQQMVPRKYFSGGVDAIDIDSAMIITDNVKNLQGAGEISGDYTVNMRVVPYSPPANKILGEIRRAFGARRFSQEVMDRLNHSTDDILTVDDIGRKIRWDANKMRHILESRKAARRRIITASEEFIDTQLNKVEQKRNSNDGLYWGIVHDDRIIDTDKGNYQSLYNEVKEVLGRILRANGFDPNDFELYLTDTGNFNAFAVPWDNKIAVDIRLVKDLIENNSSKDAMAFVLGHELRHIIQSFDDILDGKEVEIGNQRGIKESMVRYISKHSDEDDADYFAVSLMAQAGYTVKGALDVLNMLPNSQGWDKVFSQSHPPSHKRLRRIKALINNQYWPSWEKDKEFFSLETRRETSQRTRSAVFQVSSNDVRTREELIFLINASRSVEELTEAFSGGYKRLLLYALNNRESSFLFQNVLVAFKTKLFSLLSGNDSGNIIATLIWSNALSGLMTEGDLNDRLSSNNLNAARMLWGFVRDENKKRDDYLEENIKNLNNEGLEALLNDPMVKSHQGKIELDLKIYSKMVKNIMLINVTIDQISHLLDLKSDDKRFNNSKRELWLWALKNETFLDSLTNEDLRSFMSYTRIFGYDQGRLGESLYNYFIDSLREAASRRTDIKTILLDYAREKDPLSDNWLIGFFSQDISLWQHNEGEKSLFLFKGSNFDEDLESMLSFPVLRDSLIENEQKLWEILKQKHQAGEEERYRFIKCLLTATKNTEINFGLLEPKFPTLYGYHYFYLLEEFVEYHKGTNVLNGDILTRAFKDFIEAGGILGPEQIREFIGKYSNELSAVDLGNILLALTHIKDSWIKRLPDLGALNEDGLVAIRPDGGIASQSINDFWKNVTLLIEYNLLVKRLGKEGLMVNKENDKTFRILDNFFYGEFSFSKRNTRGNSSYRLNRFDGHEKSDLVLDALRLMMSIVDSTLSYDDIRGEILRGVQPSVFRNFLLYVLLIREIRSYGVEIAEQDFLNEKKIVGKLEGLPDVQAKELSSRLKGLKEYLVVDREILEKNKIEQQRAQYNAFLESPSRASRKSASTLNGLTASDRQFLGTDRIVGGRKPSGFSDQSRYENFLFAEVGGRNSQLNIFIPALDVFNLRHQINSSLPFHQKLQEIIEHFPSSKARDYWLDYLLTHEGTMGSKDYLEVLPYFLDQSLQEQYALHGFDKAYEEHSGFRTQDEEIMNVLKFFPEISYLRDDILLQTLERWVYRPEDDRVSQLFYQNPEHMREGSQQSELFKENMLFQILPELDPIDRVQLLFWLMGISGKEAKPVLLRKYEDHYQVNFDSMREVMAFKSKHYANAGKTDRRLLVERILGGEKSVFEDQDADKYLIEKLFAEVVGDQGTDLMKDVYEAIFKNADSERKLFIVTRLIEGLSKISREGEVKGKDLDEIMGVFLQALGLVGVKAGQALGIKNLEDNAEPIDRRVVFDMIRKIYGVFSDKFEGLYQRRGSASIKNVFRARLKEGREVALKIKRPDIAKTLDEDFQFFEKVVNDLRAKGHSIPLGLVKRVRTMVNEEMNFKNEAFVNQPLLQSNILKRQTRALLGWTSVKRIFAERLIERSFQVHGQYFFYVPQSIEEQNNVLIIEEYVSDSVSFGDVEGLKRVGVDPQDLRKAIRNELMREIIIDGVYQLDPNRGNFLIQVQQPGGTGGVKVNLIDVGAVGHLSGLNKIRLAKVLSAIDARNPQKVMFYSSPSRVINKVFIGKIGTVLNGSGTRESKLLDVLDLLERNDVKISEEWMGIMRFMGAGKHLFNGSPKVDGAMYAGRKNTGGIDLTPTNMNLQIRNAGEGIKFHINPVMLKQLENAPGFVPVIISIEPMTSLRMFLGVPSE